jgi:tellurite resistance protein TehA-like permease
MNVIKTSTWIAALILGLLGILLYLLEYGSYAFFAYQGLIGFVLLLIGWLLMIIAVRTKGL